MGVKLGNIFMDKIDIESRQVSDKIAKAAITAAKCLKVLANPNRLVILTILIRGETCVGDLEKELKISQSALSQHLSRMRDEDIVTSHRKKQKIFYKINDDRVKKMLNLLFRLYYQK